MLEKKFVFNIVNISYDFEVSKEMIDQVNSMSLRQVMFPQVLSRTLLPQPSGTFLTGER